MAVCQSLVHACALRCAGHIAGKQSQIKGLQCFQARSYNGGFTRQEVDPSQIIQDIECQWACACISLNDRALRQNTHTQCTDSAVSVKSITPDPSQARSHLDTLVV